MMKGPYLPSHVQQNKTHFSFLRGMPYHTTQFMQKRNYKIYFQYFEDWERNVCTIFFIQLAFLWQKNQNDLSHYPENITSRI